MCTKDRSPNNRHSRAGRRAASSTNPAAGSIPKGLPKVVDEDVYASNGMSTEFVPAALPSTILFSDAPPPLDRTSNSAIVDPHDFDLLFAPLGTPARLIAGASLARLPSAWTDGSPSIHVCVPAQPSGAAVLSTPQHVLQDALVGASCWSIPRRELVPSTMSRPSCPADVADDQGSHAHVPEPYEGDADISTY